MVRAEQRLISLLSEVEPDDSRWLPEFERVGEEVMTALLVRKDWALLKKLARIGGRYRRGPLVTLAIYGLLILLGLWERDGRALEEVALPSEQLMH